MHNVESRAIERGAVDLERAVEIERDMAVGAHQRQRLALKNAVVGGVAQVVALPGVAVDQQHVDAALRHRRQQAPLAIGMDHQSFQREKRASTSRTSSLSAIAISASVRTRAISAAGLKVSEYSRV